MTTTAAPQQYAYVHVNDIVVGNKYHHQGRQVTVIDVVIESNPLGFFEITYVSSNGAQRVNKAPKNRATDFIVTL